MALMSKELADRLEAIEEALASLEEQVALLEEALAPVPMHPEVHDAHVRSLEAEGDEWPRP